MTDTSKIPLQVYQVLEEEYISLHGPLDHKNEVVLPDNNISVDKYRLVRARRDWRFHRGHIKNPISLARKLVLARGGSKLTPLSEHLAEKIPAATLDNVLIHVRPFAANLNALFGEHEPEPQDTPTDAALPADPAAEEAARALTQAPAELSPDAQSKQMALEEAHARLVYKAREGHAPADIEKAQKALREFENSLNTVVLEDVQLARPDLIRHVTLSDFVRGLLELGQKRFESCTSFRGSDLRHFNRLLLEEAYPDEFEKVHNVRLAAIHQHFHRLENHAALCLSGGGIRSGTFALGLIQGLARRDLLKGFDYLSTVSGGGYMGGWLTAWIQRHAEGLAGVTRSLANCPPASKIDPDPDPIIYLRNYSNFITPKVGLLTADTWAFVGIYLRNLLLNWFVLIPLLLGWLMLPRLYAAAVLARSADKAITSPGTLRQAVSDFFTLALDPRHYLLVFGCLLSAWAIAYITFNRPYVREQLKVRSPFWFRRTDQRSFLFLCLLPFVGAAICLTIYWAWSRAAGGAMFHKAWWTYPAFGATVALLGWLAAVLVLGRWRPAHWKELSLYEFVSMAGAGAIGGLLFRLAGFSPPPPSALKCSWTTWWAELYACLGVPTFLVGFLIALTLFIGLTSHTKKITDEDREWWARAGAWVLIVIIAWLVFGGLVIFGPLALLYSPKFIASVGGISGLIATLAGRSAKTPASKGQEEQRGLLASVMGGMLPLLAALFIAVFIAALSLLTSWAIIGLALLLKENAQKAGDLATRLQEVFFRHSPEVTGLSVHALRVNGRYLNHIWGIHYPSFLLVLGLMAAFLLVGYFMARVINLNRFSIHAGYRDRLIRGFLGASRRKNERKPNPFTGFDPADNIRMHELRPVLFHEGDFKNLSGLAVKLQKKADPVSQYLWEQHIAGKDGAQTEAQAELETYSEDALPSQALKVALMEALNRALEDDKRPLHEAPPFQTGQWPEEVQTLRTWRKLHPHRDYDILLNRLLLQSFYPELEKKYPPPHRLLHLVNTTLNLVGGDNLAWQQRKAEPFSVTSLHAGCFRLGYRKAQEYGADNGISIGTAMAISGAAASSNMGYMTTSPVLAMVLTLFNVRLGWWLGNPGPAGDTTYRRQSPKYSVAPIVSEAFGLTDDRHKYVYLTDGGHFDNLGLYEMVLRRCKIIIASDGTQDEKYKFNDLGSAVRKIRIDLGVPIEFKDVPIGTGAAGAEGAKAGGSYWAIGLIRYSCVDAGAEDGLLLYVKPALYGREPQDVLNYKRAHPAFPHESTADQFFDEPQFESYRELGSHILEQMYAAADSSELQKLAAGLYWQVKREGKWECPDIKAKWLDALGPAGTR
jgi:Patatin-like phospholipase